MLLKGTIRIEGSFRPPSLAHIHCKEVQIEIEKVNRERKKASSGRRVAEIKRERKNNWRKKEKKVKTLSVESESYGGEGNRGFLKAMEKIREIGELAEKGGARKILIIKYLNI